MQMESNNVVQELTIDENNMPIEHIGPVYLVSRLRQWLIKESIVMGIPSRCIRNDGSFQIITNICAEELFKSAWKMLSSRSLRIQFVDEV